MILRSLLFVPGDSDRKLGKGHDSGADALILDLEDAGAPACKMVSRGRGRRQDGGGRGFRSGGRAARPSLRGKARRLGRPGMQAALAGSGVDSLILTNVTTSDDLDGVLGPPASGARSDRA
jgi:hypothetical protein